MTRLRCLHCLNLGGNLSGLIVNASLELLGNFRHCLFDYKYIYIYNGVVQGQDVIKQ